MEKKIVNIYKKKIFCSGKVFCLSSNRLPESSLTVVNYCVSRLPKPFRAVKRLPSTPCSLKEITVQLTFS